MDELKELLASVNSINTKLEVALQRDEDFRSAYHLFCNQNNADHEAIMTKQDKTNGRVRSLEKWRWAFSGGLTVLVILVGWLFNFIQSR